MANLPGPGSTAPRGAAQWDGSNVRTALPPPGVRGSHSDGHALPRNDGACECAQVSARYVAVSRVTEFQTTVM